MPPSQDISERFIRRHIYAPAHRAVVEAGPGFTAETEVEIRALIDSRVTPSHSHPTFVASHGHVFLNGIDYRSLLELTLRTACATDIGLVIAYGHAENRKQLESIIDTTELGPFVAAGEPVAVRAASRASRIYHTGIIEEIAASSFGRRGYPIGMPSEGTGQILTLDLSHNRLRVVLSLAGEPLWRRGYRSRLEAVAPLREDLAHCAVRKCVNGLPGTTPPEVDEVFVPFAGTGTLAFESIIALYGIPPFIFRDASGIGYAVDRFPIAPPPSVEWAKRRLVDGLRRRIESGRGVRVRMVDAYQPACETARDNADRLAGMVSAAFGDGANVVPGLKSMEVLHEDVLIRPWAEYIDPSSRAVFVPLNPPYGRRVAVHDAASTYQRIGRRLQELSTPRNGVARPPQTVRGFILCPDETTWRAFLRAAPSFHCSTSHFSQGGLDIRLTAFTNQ